MFKAILFINGNPPTRFPDTDGYFVICTDGAYNYLKNTSIAIDVLIGDLDSVEKQSEPILAHEVIKAFDQDYTDFQKALKYLVEKQFEIVEVYGAVGKEEDHFLGNLTAGVQFQKKLKITFHAETYSFWLLKKEETLSTEVGKTISLYPYPKAKKIKTQGLKFPLHRENLSLKNRIGIRNEATEKEVKITFEKGNLWIFVYH